MTLKRKLIYLVFGIFGFITMLGNFNGLLTPAIIVVLLIKTVLIMAILIVIAEKLYSWIRPAKKRLY